jgi:hypothetical protein
MDVSQSELDKLSCKIIKDKTLSRHDALYKLILIGDTCKLLWEESTISASWVDQILMLKIRLDF